LSWRWRRCVRSLERLWDGGIPLGVFPDASYDQAMVPASAGDRIVLFTDGITEACTASNEEFGEDGLVAAFRGCARLTARELKERIIDALTRRCGSALRDDATLVVVASD
jgi:sigma-B regulation protein RsbU (phosphoserine phosphatase)